MIDAMTSICYIMKVVLLVVLAHGHQMEAEQHIFSDTQIEAPADLSIYVTNGSHLKHIYLF